jgi:hypothetical protein
VEVYKTVLTKKTMGKKKKALQAEIDRLNAQKPPTEITSYKNINNTPRTSVAAVLGSAMTGYKTSSGPSMYGDSYNYKEINSCGPSMKGDDVKLKAMPKLQKQTASIVEREAPSTPTFTPLRKKFSPSYTYNKAATKLDEIEGTPGGAGTKKMLRDTAADLATTGLAFGVSAIQGRKATKQAAKQAFRNRFSSTSSGSGYVGTQKSQSYGDSEKKYSRGMFG